MSDEFYLQRIAELERRLQEIESIDSPAIVAGAYSNSGQAIAHNTFTAINFNVTVWDTYAKVTTIPNWRYTIPIGGYYDISAALGIGLFDANWAVGEAQHLWIYVNGAGYTQLDAFYNATAGGGIMLSGARTIPLNRNDYVEIFGYQFSGVGLNLVANGNINWVSIHKVRGHL